MSNSDGRVRKSNRQPVPNPIYQQGITQLKNVGISLNKENTTRPKRNPKNLDQNLSYDQDRNSYNNYQLSSVNEVRDQYLPCRLPNGNLLKVKFVIEGKREQKKKQTYKQVIIQPPAKQTSQQPVATVQKKPATNNLLNIFIEAIDNAAAAGDKIELESSQGVKSNQSVIQKQKVISMRQKRSRLQQQDFIKKVTIQNGVMKIQHSSLNQLQYQVDWQEDEMVEEDRPEIQEMRKKLQNSKMLKNISILMAE